MEACFVFEMTCSNVKLIYYSGEYLVGVLVKAMVPAEKILKFFPVLFLFTGEELVFLVTRK